VSARRAIAAAVAALAALVPACGGSSTHAVTVFGAASLTGVLPELRQEFLRGRAGERITLDLAGTPQLVAQIEAGAPADVVATADEASLAELRARRLLDGPAVVFARNRLAIAVRPGNPRHIRDLADLAQSGLVVVFADARVPAGKYAAAALGRAHVSVHPASLEQDVKAVVAKVALGEADAGIVYVTDVRAAGGKVAGVAIAASDNVVAGYPIAAITARGRAFRDFVLSPEGQRVLRRAGFSSP